MPDRAGSNIHQDQGYIFLWVFGMAVYNNHPTLLSVLKTMISLSRVAHQTPSCRAASFGGRGGRTYRGRTSLNLSSCSHIATARSRSQLSTTPLPPLFKDNNEINTAHRQGQLHTAVVYLASHNLHLQASALPRHIPRNPPLPTLIVSACSNE